MTCNLESVTFRCTRDRTFYDILSFSIFLVTEKLKVSFYFANHTLEQDAVKRRSLSPEMIEKNLDTMEIKERKL